MPDSRLSVVMLSWKRPANIARVVDDLLAHAVVDDITVWNNNPQCALSLPAAVRVIDSPDLGLYTRFAAGCLARHEMVFVQDDDLLLSPGTLDALHRHALGEPDVLHGIFGRAPTAAGRYARLLEGSGQVPIVLTRALVCARRYCAKFFEHVHRFDELQRDSVPYGNGEDIIFSYLAMKESGRMNRIHALPVLELPAEQSIFERSAGHFEHRTRIMQACQRWLEGREPAGG
jgi:glycosyl transferase family 64